MGYEKELFVYVPLNTYSELVQNNEKLKILKRIYDRSDYLMLTELADICGFERKDEAKKMSFEEMLGDTDAGTD